MTALPNLWTPIMEWSVRLIVEYMPKVPCAVHASCLNTRVLGEFCGAVNHSPTSHALHFRKDETYSEYGLCVINAYDVGTVEHMVWWLQIVEPRAIHLRYVDHLSAQQVRALLDFILVNRRLTHSRTPVFTNLLELKVGDRYAYYCVGALEGLCNCTNLRVLDLSMCQSLRSLIGLSLFPALEELVLKHTPVESLEPLRFCLQIRKLCLSGCGELRHINGLHDVRTLKILDLTNTPIENLEPLRNITGLKQLRLSGCRALSSAAASLENMLGLELIVRIP